MYKSVQQKNIQIVQSRVLSVTISIRLNWNLYLNFTYGFSYVHKNVCTFDSYNESNFNSLKIKIGTTV